MVKPVRYPLVEEIATPLSPLQVFELFKDRPFSFFLDSGMDPQRLGRFSFIGCDPFLVLRSRGNEVTLTQGKRQHVLYGSPFDILRHILEVYSIESFTSPIPFNGGAVGYFSYDLYRSGEAVFVKPGYIFKGLEFLWCVRPSNYYFTRSGCSFPFPLVQLDGELSKRSGG